jgi:hypothetical protein
MGDAFFNLKLPDIQAISIFLAGTAGLCQRPEPILELRSV